MISYERCLGLYRDVLLDIHVFDIIMDVVSGWDCVVRCTCIAILSWTWYPVGAVLLDVHVLQYYQRGPTGYDSKDQS